LDETVLVELGGERLANAVELGIEFYMRILSFGAVPLFTWLAYQFPDIGSVIFNLFQPVAQVMK
jgi:hypothetical protein